MSGINRVFLSSLVMSLIAFSGKADLADNYSEWTEDVSSCMKDVSKIEECLKGHVHSLVRGLTISGGRAPKRLNGTSRWSHRVKSCYNEDTKSGQGKIRSCLMDKMHFLANHLFTKGPGLMPMDIRIERPKNLVNQLQRWIAHESQMHKESPSYKPSRKAEPAPNE